MHPFFTQIRKGLIVSCQAEGDSPFNNPEGVASFAICAEMGGAVAIRSEGVQNIREIRNKVSLPLIGLIKSSFPDGSVRITGSKKEVNHLMEAGCGIIAIDGTMRLREGMTGPGFIRMVKASYQVLVMADIASHPEAQACIEAGADCISTTLSGYTPATMSQELKGPDFALLEKLVSMAGYDTPIIAEGRYNTPELARKAIEKGAWAVVSGTAITRPQTITKWFYDAINQKI
ncbi:MAG: N-acetylmannosamine-6-phosphate 2-epimerase [Bacteroidales bacterium]